MIIVMNAPTPEQTNRVLDKIRHCGLEPHCLVGRDKTIITTVGDTEPERGEQFERLAGVERVVSVNTPYKLASRQFHAHNSVVAVNDVRFGAEAVPVIAGPCAVESYEQFRETALAAKDAGAAMLRGGAFKPRTSPYSFQGLENEGLKIMQAVGREVGLPVVTEVTDPRAVGLVSEFADMLQIGARNMQNFALLKEVALAGRPVLLKRGVAATIEEWLMAAEYLLSGGSSEVVLCERGIRTYENYTRNTLDLSAVPLVKHLSHLPVVVDPSHGTGNWRLVGPMARAAVAAGADGLIIEIHPWPEEAMSDGPQSLTLANFRQLTRELAKVAAAVGRTINHGKGGAQR
ncbi:3-deoxy-7-phosphoheptulonate synthase [Anaeroselena agilis]|uniref:3-deoxy-7-phosphoheptulonate synthase n=1 Tax=Anaeroselena agilis TaxID=3063788 RepID=A0ABU3NWI5_9FIRM|nr:3-deoxy-7-phosphoheptulonate synthase [Selenomonadales bacterium 4137-cl]